MNTPPVLYSFRRCPYAMRARMAMWASATRCELREVVLANKPAEMLAASPKGTVPVMVTPAGDVIDESIDIMRHALSQNDPENWLSGDDRTLIERIDGAFKHHLDRYKYHTRYGTDPLAHRDAALEILAELDQRLSNQKNLCGEARTLADIATFPFIRQFANHDRAWFDAQPLPYLIAWLQRHLTSDLFAAIMVKFPAWKPGDTPVIFAP